MDSDPLISRVMGNYQIEERLGRGGMSTVYRARQLTMQRDVAIKIMSAELATDPQFIARFEREAQVIANLEHPRILPVHDYGHAGEYFYLVMRLVDGESLHDRLLRGPLTLSEAADLLDQIASALDYAHAKGVIHRDLKPNNVLVDRLGNIYLMDFGIAKLMAATQQLTATGMVMGTPAYMAPEQWRGEPVDVRTDVYALGVMLYEMVLGVQPFEAADTPFTLMYKHLNDAPPSPRALLPDLPEAVERAILRALSKNPDDRFQSAGHLARAFRAAIQATTPVTAAVTEVPIAGTETLPIGASEAETMDIPLPQDMAPPIPSPVPSARAAPEQAEAQGSKKSKLPVPPRQPGPIPAARSTSLVVTTTPVSAAPIDQVPTQVKAIQQVQQALGAQETLAGVIDVRGTPKWRTRRRLFMVGVVVLALSGLGHSPQLCLLGVLIWIYLGVELVRIWAGASGQFYVGFTPSRIVFLPHTSDGSAQSEEMRSVDWRLITHLRLSSHSLTLDAETDPPLYFRGLLPENGEGGLAAQRRWLPNSPVTELIRQKGHEAANQE